MHGDGFSVLPEYEPGERVRAEPALDPPSEDPGRSDARALQYAHRSSVASVASVQSCLGNDRAKVRWAKALWWASQEARRRKAQQIAEQRLARSHAKTGRLRQSVAMIQWITKSSSSTVAPLTMAADGTSDFMCSHAALETVVGGGSNKEKAAKQQRHSEDSEGSMAGSHHGSARRWRGSWSRNGSSFSINPSSPLAAQVQRVLQSPAYIYLTVFCTFWVLGGDDVYLLQDPPMSWDRAIYMLYVVCAAQFVLDLVLRTVWERGYALCFYFWLDLIAVLSLAPEVVFVVAEYDLFDLGIASLARSGRAASAGARVVRILRIVKLLKQVYELSRRRNGEADNELGDTSSSELARKLHDYVTIHVIIAVGAMLALRSILFVCHWPGDLGLVGPVPPGRRAGGRRVTEIRGAPEAGSDRKWPWAAWRLPSPIRVLKRPFWSWPSAPTCVRLPAAWGRLLKRASRPRPRQVAVSSLCRERCNR